MDSAKINLGFNHKYLQFNNVVANGKSHDLFELQRRCYSLAFSIPERISNAFLQCLARRKCAICTVYDGDWTRELKS